MDDILNYLDNFYKYTPLPVLAVRERQIIYTNPFCESFFKVDVLGDYAAKYFMTFPYPNGSIVSSRVVGKQCNVSCVEIEDVLILTVIEQPEIEAVSSIPVSKLSSMNTAVATLFIAAEKLSESCADDDKADLYTSVLFQNFYKLMNITELLSIISKLQAGTYTIPDKLVELPSFIRDISETIKYMLDGTGIILNYKKPEKRIYIKGSKDLVERMILEIVANSIAHTPSGGEITISLATIRSFAVINIADNGRGIPASKLAHAFELNHVVMADDKYKYEGGLGLPFASLVASAHGGSAVINSIEGVGTNVAVSMQSTFSSVVTFNSPPIPYGPQIPEKALMSFASSLPRGKYTIAQIYGR